jgi:hypothetical protein
MQVPLLATVGADGEDHHAGRNLPSGQVAKVKRRFIPHQTCLLCGNRRDRNQALCFECTDTLSWKAIANIWNRRHPDMPMNAAAVKSAGLRGLSRVRQAVMADPVLGEYITRRFLECEWDDGE